MASARYTNSYDDDFTKRTQHVSSSEFIDQSVLDELSEDSLVKQRRETDISITDRVVDSEDKAKTAAAQNYDSQQDSYFQVNDITVVAPKIRARRMAKSLIALGIGLVVIVVIVIAVVLMNINSQQQAEEEQVVTIEATQLSNLNLAGMFGVKYSQVQAQLSGFELVSTSALVADTSATDKQNTEAATITTDVYTNDLVAYQNNPLATTATVIEISYDGDGIVTRIKYSANMDAAGYPQVPFQVLVADDQALSATLLSVGLESSITSYTAPEESQYTTYVDATATNKQVASYSTTFQGTANILESVATWEVEFTYDEVVKTPDGNTTRLDTPLRTVTVTLS